MSPKEMYMMELDDKLIKYFSNSVFVCASWKSAK